MSPDGGGNPEGELAAAIGDAFGSMDALRAQLNEATTSHQGSGWGVLVWEPFAGSLMVQQVYDHQSNMTPGNLPLLVIDGWEHAFYLQFQTDKQGWVDSFWKMVNWPMIADRFEKARSARLPDVALAGN
jgi:Fe-Mn family superoxide dismutase